MTIALGLALMALVLAVASHLRAQALARRLDVLTELYWELKYDHGTLKAQVNPPVPPASAPPPTAFVPLTAIKKSGA
ncbi:MAG: hypothetical protein FJW29_00365 [Acidobacteria bacterium]|nr:hypothetical protein [Acidobacteriota bacterium]